MRTVTTLRGEGGEVPVFESGGLVWFLADADIDADGANGQVSGKGAYHPKNIGHDHLANAGYPNTSWWKDILVDVGGKAKVQDASDPAPGYFISKTSYRYKGRDPKSARAYVDSETVPYIVVSPLVQRGVKGVVLGCKARATNVSNGRVVDCVVADIGPRTKAGELSIAAAEALGIPSSARTGGTNSKIVKYELWPDVPAFINAELFTLQRANGTYVG